MSMSMLNVHVSVHVHAAHHKCVCVCECVFVCVFMCVFMCINAGMPDCPASDQSSTGIKKTNDAGTGPVPNQIKAVRHFLVRYWTEIIDTDAGVSFLDADDQLCQKGTFITFIRSKVGCHLRNIYCTSFQLIFLKTKTHVNRSNFVLLYFTLTINPLTP
jgi:hypothetical protein